jgi:hypothetical protein
MSVLEGQMCPQKEPLDYLAGSSGPRDGRQVDNQVLELEAALRMLIRSVMHAAAKCRSAAHGSQDQREWRKRWDRDVADLHRLIDFRR